jgi:hypothetical protein
MARVDRDLHRGSWKVVCIWTQAAAATAELRTPARVEERSIALTMNGHLDDLTVVACLQ